MDKAIIKKTPWAKSTHILELNPLPRPEHLSFHMVLSTYSLINRPWKESFDMSYFAKNLFLNLDELIPKKANSPFSVDTVDMSEVTFSELSFYLLWFFFSPFHRLCWHILSWFPRNCPGVEHGNKPEFDNRSWKMPVKEWEREMAVDVHTDQIIWARLVTFIRSCSWKISLWPPYKTKKVWLDHVVPIFLNCWMVKKKDFCLLTCSAHHKVEERAHR